MRYRGHLFFFFLWIYILYSTICWKDCFPAPLQYYISRVSNDHICMSLFLGYFFIFHWSTLSTLAPKLCCFNLHSIITSLYVQKGKFSYLVLPVLLSYLCSSLLLWALCSSITFLSSHNQFCRNWTKSWHFYVIKSSNPWMSYYPFIYLGHWVLNSVFLRSI